MALDGAESLNLLQRLATDYLVRTGAGGVRAYTPPPESAFDEGTAGAGTPNDYLSYARTSNVVYACATLRARMLSGLPIKAYKINGTGTGRTVDMRDPRARMGMPSEVRGQRLADAARVEEVSGGKLMQLVNYVNPDWTRRNLVYMTELSLCLAGQSFWQLDMDGTELWFKRHDRFTVVKGSDTPVAGWILDKGRGSTRLAADEVIWFRYPDPTDPDYGALPPMAAARLGADSYTAAMRANKNIFDNGINAAGLLMPGDGAGGYLTPDQLQDIAAHIDRRLKGADKAHRIGVVPYNVDIKQLSVTPKDAEFQALLDFAIEDVARAFGVPVEFVGGSRRTYQNLENAMVAIWMQTLEPEASWIADEMTEKLVPLFPGEADFLAFDLSGVSALQADEAAEWAREKERFTVYLQALQAVGAGTITPESAVELMVVVTEQDRAEAEAIVGDGPPPPAPAPEPAPVVAQSAAPSAVRVADQVARDFPAYGTREHETLWRAAVARPDKHTAAVGKVVAKLMERQRDAILARLDGRRASRLTPADLKEIFQRPRWVREFREGMRKALAPVMVDAAGYVSDATSTKPLGASDPAAIRFLMARSQRFAEQVNETTWSALQSALADGMANGDGIPALANTVRAVMADRIRSSGETIARTEVIGAFNGGAVVAAKETGLELEKTWVSSLDERVRNDHADAHGQTVAMDEDFTVGECSGPAPGDTGCAEQDINCRCVSTFSEKTRASRPAVAIVGAEHG